MRPDKAWLVYLAAVLLAGCASYPPAPAPVAVVVAPRLGAGETWVYEQINPYNGQHVRTLTDTLVRAEGGFELVERSSRERDPVETQYGPGPWALALERAGPTGRTFAPALDLVRFPLAPGASWRQTIAVRDERGTTHVWHCVAHALDWERVRTPAGEFTALRIVLQQDLGDSDAAWNDTTVYEVLWYAPTVRRWVRRELRTQQVERAFIPRVRQDWIVWELADYHR